MGAVATPFIEPIAADITPVGHEIYRYEAHSEKALHTGDVYNAMLNAANGFEEKLKVSIETYQTHPDVQANLQQLQYDLQMWNLALTTMTNINKNMGDALNSIASNFR